MKAMFTAMWAALNFGIRHSPQGEVFTAMWAALNSTRLWLATSYRVHRHVGGSELYPGDIP